MARARSTFGGFRSRSRARRQTSWELGPGGNTPIQFTATGEGLVGDGVAAALGGITVVRIRGQLDIILTAAAAAIEGFHGAFGICIVNEDAFAVGVSAVPDPLADVNWDGWIFHHFFDVHSITGTIADGSNASAVHQRINVDSKAMRKFLEEEVMVAKIEVVENGTSTMNAFFDSRVLIKVP